MVGVFKIENQEQLKKAFQVRQEVFVQEQNVSREEEYDQFEESATHFLATDDKGVAYGTARWRETEKGIKLERFAVKKDRRGEGVGSMLLESVLEDIAVQHEGNPILLYLHAQVTALPLYEKFGFQKEGEPFEECGLQHYKMSRML